MMTMADDLSENQQEMLLRFFQGDWPTPTVEGYYWACEPVRVDGRTLGSLIKRGLISTGLSTSSGLISQNFILTEHGEEIAKELDEAAYQKRQARRGW